MKSLTGSCFLAVLLSGLLNSAQAINKEMYVPVGGSMKLTPLEQIKDLASILWKYNNNLVAEWVKDSVPLEYYPKYRDRTTLDIVTGHLTISKLTQDDAGVYTVETNNRVQNDGYDVKVVKNVTKPEVVIRPLVCDSTSPSCTLTCEGDTTGTGPITYSWKRGGIDWPDMGKVVPITNDDETKKVQTFSCRMKNPVSQAESDPINNPFTKVNASNGVGLVVGLLFGLFLVIIAGGVALFLIRRFRPDLFRQIFCCSNNANNGTPSNGVPMGDGTSPAAKPMLGNNGQTNPEGSQTA